MSQWLGNYNFTPPIISILTLTQTTTTLMEHYKVHSSNNNQLYSELTEHSTNRWQQNNRIEVGANTRARQLITISKRNLHLLKIIKSQLKMIIMIKKNWLISSWEEGVILVEVHLGYYQVKVVRLRKEEQSLAKILLQVAVTMMNLSRQFSKQKLKLTITITISPLTLLPPRESKE